jgi:hypothetical protein
VKLDMSPSAIDARLRHVSVLSDSITSEQLIEAKIDMSPPAISRRLREVSELRDLCLRLKAAWHRDGDSEGG